MVWPFMGLNGGKPCCGKDNAHARRAGQVIAFHRVVTVVQLVELFASVDVQHVCPACWTQDAVKLSCCSLLVANMRKGRKTD